MCRWRSWRASFGVSSIGCRGVWSSLSGSGIWRLRVSWSGCRARSMSWRLRASRGWRRVGALVCAVGRARGSGVGGELRRWGRGAAWAVVEHGRREAGWRIREDLGPLEELVSGRDELLDAREGERAGRFEGLSARLEELLGGREELTGAFEQLSGRFEELMDGRQRGRSRASWSGCPCGSRSLCVLVTSSWMVVRGS